MTGQLAASAARIAPPPFAPHDWDGWCAAARQLLASGIAPGAVDWTAAQGTGDLFAQPLSPRGGPRTAAGAAARVPRGFVAMGEQAILHSDPERHGLLYDLLWRLQQQPRLLHDAVDAGVRALDRLVAQVRRDIHKMRAFVRFRELIGPDGTPRYIAWFEPSYAILRANAGFFVDRFAAQHWSILTPLGSLHWDGDTLHEGPPAQRGDAPGGDPLEDLWRGYYAAIFNPARVKIGAMLKEMPRRYWRNMPETALIPELIAGAQAREAGMIAAGSVAPEPRAGSLEELATRLQSCRRCPIGCNGTRAVAGRGSTSAALVIIGEQPGDREERAGQPFVGPAGQVLHAALAAAGIAPGAAYLTNAVKHFKHQPTGKRRLHQTPTAGEIDHCRWWLDQERDLIRPRLILALGASAARGLLGRTVSIAAQRGQWTALDAQTRLLMTFHPSYLLRLDGDARARAQQVFAADLQQVSEALIAL